MSKASICVVIPVRNGAQVLAGTLAALRRQSVTISIVVVDDGSSDGSAEVVKTEPDLSLVQHQQSLGRAAARNAGAKLAESEWLLFLDCDRCPLSDNFIAAHLSTAQASAGSMGAVEAEGSGFWPAYQRHSAAQGAESQPVGLWQFSSANFLIRRAQFEALGGFDERYRHYGFEDRDFYARLLATGQHLLWAPKARAKHTARLSLAEVWLKMAQCGQYTAPRFRGCHPKAYGDSRYARLDVHLHSLLMPLARLTPLLQHTLPFGEYLLQRRWLPFAWRRSLALAYSAAAFLGGGLRAAKARA